jgi:hypothetical protein
MENSVIEGIGDISNIVYRALFMAEKTIIEPILVPGENYYIIFQVDKKTPSRVKTIYEVMDEIHDQMKQEKTLAEIIKEAEKFRGNPLLDTSHETSSVTIDYNSRKDYKYEFITEALSLKNGQSTKVYFDNGKAYYAKVVNIRKQERVPLYANVKPQLKIELQNMDRDDFYRDWLTKRTKKAKVKDWREGM